MIEGSMRVTLAPDLAKDLKAFCRNNGLSAAAVVREAIRAAITPIYLKRPNG